MSTEGPGKNYSPEEIEAFEKTRIQDPEQAQEMANMLRVRVGEEAPVAEDYDRALAYLDELEEESKLNSESVDKVTKPLRNVLAGIVVAGGTAGELLGLALLNLGTHVGMYPKSIREEDRRRLVERIKQIPADFKSHSDNLSSARELLEKWKEEAEAIHKK